MISWLPSLPASLRASRQLAAVFLAFLVFGPHYSLTGRGIALAESTSYPAVTADPDLFTEDDWDEEEPVRKYVADPMEPVNRFFFSFNDKLYFWLIKPVARGYAAVIPVSARECVDNFFFNLRMPIRLVNSIMQGKLRRSGEEFSRFAVNTTIGIGGLWDPARDWFNLSPSHEDMGQTLGKYGIGEGIYICWPFLGPSNLRDSLGLAGDYFLDPVNYLTINNEAPEALGLKAGDTINHTSLRLGDYEALIEGSFDPYSAIRDGYIQSRRSKINDETD
jgi:phospholipid-binding lipoprotein MlaA